MLETRMDKVDLNGGSNRDLNPRPSDYESPALTPELWAHPIDLVRYKTPGSYFARVRIQGKLFFIA